MLVIIFKMSRAKLSKTLYQLPTLVCRNWCYRLWFVDDIWCRWNSSRIIEIALMRRGEDDQVLGKVWKCNFKSLEQLTLCSSHAVLHKRSPRLTEQ